MPFAYTQASWHVNGSIRPVYVLGRQFLNGVFLEVCGDQSLEFENNGKTGMASLLLTIT